MLQFLRVAIIPAGKVLARQKCKSLLRKSVGACMYQARLEMHMLTIPLYPGGGQRVNHVASIWGLEGHARIAEPPRLPRPSPRPHLTAWGGLPHSGDVLVQGGNNLLQHHGRH